jgi:pectin methylesterase-like acyl-CoA thioesterase
MNSFKRSCSAALCCLLIFSITLNAAVLVDDTFQDADSQNQVLPSSMRIFNGRTGTVRTDAVGSVTFAPASTSSEGFWGFFTDGQPVTLSVGDRLTVSTSFSLSGLGAAGGTDLRFGVFDSKGTRNTTNLTGGINSPTFADDTGYAARLAGTTGSGNPFTLFHRVAPGATDPLINATTPLPSAEYVEVPATSTTPRQALTNGVEYTLTYQIERINDTSTRLTVSLIGGSVNLNTTGIETSSTPHTTFDWFGMRIPGTNFATGITFSQWYANYTPAPPVIVAQPQPTNLNVQVGSNVTLSVGATGSELTYQWRKNGQPIIGNPTATTPTLQLMSVQISDSGVYDVVVSNSGGSVTSDPVNLTVTTGPVEPAPTITDQPDNTVVSVGSSASPSVTATGSNLVYQWYKNGVLIPGATGPTLTFPMAQLTDTGDYYVVVSNTGGSVTSNTVRLTVVSSMSVIEVAPPSGTMNVCVDTSIRITFDQPPLAGTSGTIRIFRSDGTLVDTIDMSNDTVPGTLVPGTQSSKNIGGASSSFNYYPILIDGNSATIYLHQQLEYNQNYYVLIEPGAITDATGAPFAGISQPNQYQFSTRAAAPAAGKNPLVVSATGGGDFCTVQGAIDFVPTNNSQRRTIYVRNGVYNEIVYVRSSKRFVTVRGETRNGARIEYANNENLNTGTLTRTLFGVDAADFQLWNITLRNTTTKLNSAGNTRQAEAFRGNNDRMLLNRVSLYSFQDTLLLQSQGPQGGYVNESYIEGDVDFTWGAGTAYFKNCELKDVAPASRPQAYYSQIRNPQGKNGNVYVGCRLTRNPDTPDNSAYLSRIDPDDFPFSQVVWIDSLMDSHIRPEGWLINNPSLDPVPANYPNIRFWEYNSRDIDTGLPVDVSQRHPLSRQLTAEEAAFWRNPANVLGGWVPNLQGTRYDFDGDGAADRSVFRPGEQTWYLEQTTLRYQISRFGLASDLIVPADYDGDGRTDIAVYRNGTWYILGTSSGLIGTQFGVAGDVPQPADFDGDGRAELAVYRGDTWYTFNLFTGEITQVQFGVSGDVPVVGDYDGDGKADRAIFRQSTGTWWYLSSATGAQVAVQFGISTDVPVPADYDGDAKTDFAVYRNGVWWILNSSNGAATAYQFGISTDQPVPADYDGDGKADIAVYRDGVWYIAGTSSGIIITQFGMTGDQPAPGAYVP